MDIRVVPDSVTDSELPTDSFWEVPETDVGECWVLESPRLFCLG